MEIIFLKPKKREILLIHPQNPEGHKKERYPFRGSVPIVGLL